MTDARPDTASVSFHARFAMALNGDDAALAPWLAVGGAPPPGLAVYRNTVAKGRADALAALFPSVEQLVGADWFRDAALEYARSVPPTGPVLDEYGADFPDWLAAFPPASDMPWTAPVARLDQAWSRAHRAVDATALRPNEVANLKPRALYAGRAILHPSAQLFWFDWTVPSIWLAHRQDAPPADMVWDLAPEGLLIVRPELTVVTHRLTRPQFDFLDACRDGQTVGGAAVAALGSDPTTPLARLFSEILLTGAITRIETGPLP